MDIGESNVVVTQLYKWELGSCIGKGTCSCVSEAVGTVSSKLSKRTVKAAVKMFKHGKNYEDAGENEVEILRYLREREAGVCDKYVVGLLDHFFHKGQLCLVFEKLCCNLHHVLLKNSSKGLPLYVLKKCGQDILAALSFLASNLVIHGDLKLSNIMWNADRGIFQLVDFGIGFIQGQQNCLQPLQSPCYRAPEIQKWNELIAQDGTQAESTVNLSCASDIWSFGCVLLYMYMGKQLSYRLEHSSACTIFSQTSQCFHMSNIKENISLPLDQRNITIAEHKSFMDFVLRMLMCAAEDRIKPDEARSHKFLTQDSYPSLADLLLLPTRVLQLDNMFKDCAEELHDPEGYQDFLSDIEEECSKFGAITGVFVPLEEKSCMGKVFVQYRDADDCLRAQEALAGRTFNGNTVITSFFPVEDFEAGNLY